MPTLTQEQQEQYFATQSGSATPLSPTAWLEQQNAVTSQSLTSTPSLDLPSTPQEPDYQSLLKSIPQLSPEPTQAETQQTDIIQQLMSTMKATGERSAAQLEAEQRLGVPQQQRELLEMTNQIRSLQMEAAAIPIQIQQEFEGRGATKGGVAPIEAGRLRENTLKALQVSAVAQAMQGNLMLAQAQADREVELRFAPLEAQLEFLKTAYSINKDILDREDKKRSQELSFILNERERFLNEQKEERQNVNNMAMTALQFGATPDVANKIMGAKSFEEAISIGGQYLGESFRLQVQAQKFQQDMAIKTYNLQVQSLLDSMNERIDKNNQEANKAFADTSEARSVTVVKGQVAQLDQFLVNRIGTADREKMTEEQWGTMAKDMSVVRAIANAEARVLNPDITRAAMGGDLNAATSLQEQTERIFDRYWKGENTRPIDLKNAIRSIDSALQARIMEADTALSRIEQIYPNSQIITTYNETSPVALSTRINQALGQGFTANEIVERLSTDPIVGNSVINAINTGYTPNEIIRFLLNQ